MLPGHPSVWGGGASPCGDFHYFAHKDTLAMRTEARSNGRVGAVVEAMYTL